MRTISDMFIVCLLNITLDISSNGSLLNIYVSRRKCLFVALSRCINRGIKLVFHNIIFLCLCQGAPMARHHLLFSRNIKYEFINYLMDIYLNLQLNQLSIINKFQNGYFSQPVKFHYLFYVAVFCPRENRW